MEMLAFCIPKNQYLYKVSVYAEKVAGVVEAPTAKITGAAGLGRVITIESSDATAEIYWSAERGGTYTKYENPVSTEAAEIYAYAKAGEVNSDTITITTNAGELVKLNGVTVTRTGDRSFSVSTSQVETIGKPTVDIAYTIGDGAVMKVANNSTINDVDGDIKAWATFEGYTDSDVSEVVFVAPYEKGEKIYSADFITLGAGKAGFTPASEETKNFTEVEGDFYSSSLNNIYLQSVLNGSNYAWLYRSGKGNANFKCQYADAFMVLENVSAGVVVDVYASNDNAEKNPIKSVINGENAYSYGGHYFFKVNAAGNLAIEFSTGSMIMTVSEYASPAVTAIQQVAAKSNKADKMIQNGKLVIVSNGRQYNAAGVVIK